MAKATGRVRATLGEVARPELKVEVTLLSDKLVELSWTSPELGRTSGAFFWGSSEAELSKMFSRVERSLRDSIVKRIAAMLANEGEWRAADLVVSSAVEGTEAGPPWLEGLARMAARHDEDMEEG